MFNLPLSVSFRISILFCHFLSPLPHPTLCVLPYINLPCVHAPVSSHALFSAQFPAPVRCLIRPLPWTLSLTSFPPFLPYVSLAHIPCPLSCLSVLHPCPVPLPCRPCVRCPICCPIFCTAV
jgi:hypothetical protein